MFEYVNIVYWVIALASLILWARFSTHVAKDIHDNLVHQSEIPWNIALIGVLLLMLVIWLTMPSFWVALPLNAIITAGFIGYYWKARVDALGPDEGHLFASTMRKVNDHRAERAVRRNSAQVQLTYLTHKDAPMNLPRTDENFAAGMTAADQLLVAALSRRAELVELVPTDAGYTCTMVADGFATSQPPVSRQTADSIIYFFKNIAGLSHEERRKPQAGTFKVRDVDGNATTWTLRTSGSTAGERLSLSANESSQWEFKLEAIGLGNDQLAQLKAIAEDTKGVVVVSAPKGHGRTSTLYALIRAHDAFTNSIYTLESNPQTEIEGVTIVPFQPTGDATYAKNLQSIFLKDPTIVLAADVPDTASADAISRFASEGRVYLGLSAPDSFSAMDRWLSLNSDRDRAIDTLCAVTAQRLVRMLCPTCKTPFQPDEGTLRRLNLPISKNIQAFKANTLPILDKKGNKIVCPDCGGSGFRGRTGIFEVLVLNDDLRKAIRAKANQTQLKDIARKARMILLVEHGIRKFAAGITAMNEVTRVIGIGAPTRKPSAPAPTPSRAKVPPSV